MDNTVIINGMSALKNDYIAEELGRIYSGINQRIRTAPDTTFANLFTSLEAKAVSDFYIKLEDKLRLTAYEVMRKAGLPENSIPAIWVRARNAVPAPQARLCNEGNYKPRSTASQHTGREEADANRAQTPELGKWILMSGVAVEVLSWMFIPSYKAWAPIVYGVGIVITGAGAYTMYQEGKTKATIPLTPEAQKKGQAQAIENVKEICKKQFELNCSIYCNWLDEITSAVVKECSEY